MEIKILEESEKRMVVEVDNTTVANLLEKELWNDSHVKISGQSINHPLVKKSVLIVETDGKESAKDAVEAAIKKIKKDVSQIKKAFK